MQAMLYRCARTGARENGRMAPNDTLYLRIAEAIAVSIRCGTLARGVRLPSVREIARRESVSIATAIQAYRSLEDARLIEARPRSGHYVCARPRSLPEPEASAPPQGAVEVDLGRIGANILRIAHDPAFISFGAACPNAALFDQDRIRRTVSRVVQRHRGLLAGYEIGPGRIELRRAIARHALAWGCALDARRITITNGCIESVTLALRTVTRPGDVVAVESPTYFGLLQILESLHLRALEIPTHPRTGMSVDALQLALETHGVRAVLTVPTLSNPLGACLPLAERRRLAQLVAEHDIPLIEDVIYNDLAESDERRRAVKAFDASGHVMVCGSFTKTVAPGLRLGFIDAGRWSEPVQAMKCAISGGQTAVLELALADLLMQPGHESAYRHLRATIAARVDEARGLVAAHFPRGTRVTNPPGGFILWVELPDGLDALRLFHLCLAERISIAPGVLFGTAGRYRHCIRLGVSGAWDDAHRAALERVGRIAEHLLRQRPASALRASEVVAG
jgi:DNA-binding transcriptional MocR family regulator